MAAEAKCGLEALASEFARVERPPELVEGGSLVVEDLLARSLQQDQVSRAPEPARVARTVRARERRTLEWQNDGLPSL